MFGGESDERHIYPIPGTSKSVGEPQTTPESRAVVLRFDQEGKLDQTFGGGSGSVRSSFGVRSQFHAKRSLVEALVGEVDSKDQPEFIVGGAAIELGCHAEAVTYYPRAVVRLTQAGGIDRSFSENGVAPFSGSTDSPELWRLRTAQKRSP